MKKRNSLINDTLHGNIMITDYEKRIVSTTVFNRLHNISQNSTAYLTYPTNRTKRFEHSLGTMHLCGIMFRNGVSKSDGVTLLKFIEGFKNEIEGIGIKYDLNQSSLSRLHEHLNLDIPRLSVNTENSNVSSNDEAYFLILIMYQSVRIAALLHDLGHPPFSHVTENALKKAYNDIHNIEEKNDSQTNYVDVIKSLIGGDHSKEIHETFGNKISERLLDLVKYDTSTKNIINPIVVRILQSSLSEKKKYPITHVLHSLIANSIDADRLDYIFRDSLNSGINIGQLDYTRLLSSMALVEDSGCFGFLIDMRFKSEIEEYFSKRLEIYKKVVYHHRVIKTDRLLHDIIVFLLKENLANDSFNDSGIGKLWKNLNLDFDSLDHLSEWDDAFLLHTLKYVYHKYSSDFPDSIKAKFQEFVTNDKQYFSIIKSQFDYRVFERKLYSSKNSECFVKLLSNNFNSHGIEGIYEKFNKIINFSIENITKFNLAIGSNENLIQEVLMIPKEVKNGLSKGYKVYFSEDNKIKVANFDNEISKIKMKLDNEVHDIQKLFLYVRCKDNKVLDEEQKSKLLDEIIRVTNEELAYDHKNKNGLFVAIDGPNGCGKSEIIDEVVQKLKEKYKVFATKEPTKSQFGAFTRDISNTITGEELARLVNIDRMLHMKELIHLKKDYDVIISDRYLFSSYILQGIDGVTFDQIKSINSNITLLPDLQVVIKGEYDLLTSRLQNIHVYNRLEKNKTKEEIKCTNDALEYIGKEENSISREILEIVSSDNKENDYFVNSNEIYNKIVEMLNEK